MCASDLCKVFVQSTDHILILVFFLKQFAMEVNDANMVILEAFAFMSSFLLLMLGARYYIAKKITRVLKSSQPTGQPIVDSHSCPPGTREWIKRENPVNLSAHTHNQRRPQENDERFCQTVGILKSKKF